MSSNCEKSVISFYFNVIMKLIMVCLFVASGVTISLIKNKLKILIMNKEQKK